MQSIHKVTALIVSTLLFCSVTTPALAATTSEKEEVVYIMADSGGTVDSVQVVNIFSGGNITDYGDYTSVKMLTTDDKIQTENDKITFSSRAEKVYYQGTRNDTTIPWTISVRYALDGQSVSPADIVGKSGKLKIYFEIGQNKSYQGNFFETYALQAAFTFDSNRFENLVAADATVANVGADKQVTYTILPGKGISTVIQADVTDFEMSPVSINGILLNLQVDVDEEELLSKVQELMDATVDLNDGATKISTSATTLKDNGSTLTDGTASLQSGVSDLDDGIVQLQQGIETMQQGLSKLNGRSSSLRNGSKEIKTALQTIQQQLGTLSIETDSIAELVNASSALQEGIQSLCDGVDNLQSNISYTGYQSLMSQNGIDISSLQSENTEASSNLSNLIADLQHTLSQLEDVDGMESEVAALQQQIASLSSISTLLTGNNAAIAGTKRYFESISGSTDQLKTSVHQLNDQYTVFNQSIGTLVSVLQGAVSGLDQLSDGIDTLTEHYVTFDDGLIAYTDGLGEITTSYQQMVTGISALASGSQTLLDGSKALNTGTQAFYDGIVSLCDGATTLSDGTETLKDETDSMDTEVQQQIDTLLASISADQDAAVSFASAKNTAVNRVQFVIQLAAVEQPASIKAPITEENTQTFWQKLLHLFGLS